MTTQNDFNNKINVFNNNINEFRSVLNAYTEATQNNIIALQDKYLTQITSRDATDFSTITGVRITGASNLVDTSTTNVTSASSCADKCIANPNCVGALYTDATPKTCQLYSAIPKTSLYTYDASSSFISYEHYMTNDYKGLPGALGTVNANVMNALEGRLQTLLTLMNEQIPGIGTSSDVWDTSITRFNTAKDKYKEFENAKNIYEDANSQLQNSGLDVIRTKTKYILFIAALLILLAIYVRDFNFSITVFIILFIMISVYGSIFLGAFLLVLIVLYLVYYAY
jgi:hypothetical protein